MKIKHLIYLQKKILNYLRKNKNKKEYATKNLSNKICENLSNNKLTDTKEFSTIDNISLNTKISKFNNEKLTELNLTIKNNDNINLNDFVQLTLQKINKNVNQFVFYIIKYGKNFICDKIFFFDCIKRIINIYNNLSKNLNKNEYQEIIEFIKSNLLHNIINYNNYNFISFINKRNETNLINTQFFLNDNSKLLNNFLLKIISLEHNFTDFNDKDIFEEILEKNKLKNKNIFTILRSADILYEQIRKIKSQNYQSNQTLHIKSISLRKNMKNIHKNLNNFFIYKIPQMHIKSSSFPELKMKAFNELYKSNKDVNIINNILLYDKINKKNAYFKITKLKNINHNKCNSSSGEIDVFQKMNNDKESMIKKEIINKIYNDYCFNKYNKINFYQEDDSFDISDEEQKIRRISKLSSESEIINEINCDEEDLIFNQMKEYFENIKG